MKIIGGGKYYDRATPYFVKNNILKIREIYELEVAEVVFRLAHYNKPINLSRFFTKVKTLQYILEQPDFQIKILIIIFLIIELQNSRKALSIEV